MDPITAFQVAGTVTTFVEFTRTLLTEAREVYTSPSGTTSQSVRLDRIAQDLAIVGDQVSSSLASSHSTSRTTSEETLRRLCGECKNIRNELQQALSSLQARGDTKFNYAVSSIATAFEAIWSQGRINQLDQRLQQIQSEMTMALLVSLWEEEKVHGKSRQKYMDEHMEKIEAIVKKTDQRVDRLMERLVQISSNGTVEAVRKRSLLFEELWKTNWRPDQDTMYSLEVLSDNDNTTTRLIQEHIINSLWFESIDSRDQAIAETYKSTYEWIFHEDSEAKFVDWLSDSQVSLYWITGKAGSGKSTLMKHIVHHPSTMVHLQHWADGSPILTTHFYFWEATPDPLQHSQEGLVRTILWQCLKARPNLIAKVTPRRWAAYHALRGWEGPAPKWKWNELQETFQNLASLNGTFFKLVMFIDGLDEFSGELETLLDWTKEATTRYGVKTCIGSRPWTAFSDTFDQHPTLTMQHLTAPDIGTYINGHFESSIAFKEWEALSPTEAKTLRQSISTKADGVFLWVYLVARELMAALAKGKSLHELHSIIDDLPTDIFKLYTAISGSIEAKDASRAASYFLLLDKSPIGLTVETLWFIEERTILDPDETLKASIKILGRRLDSSTRGMLEVTAPAMVNYHHRSVKEWLLLPEVSSAMEARRPRDFDANLVLLEAHIEAFCNTRAPGQPENGQRHVSSFEREDSYKVGHWSLTQGAYRASAEDCFTGVAAQFAVTPYVMAKVHGNKDLLKEKGDRRSLLHNAIFGWQTYGVAKFIFDDKKHEGRSKLVKALLDAGAPPGGRIHLPFLDTSDRRSRDMDYIDAIRQLPSNRAAAVGPEEYWNEISRRTHNATCSAFLESFGNTLDTTQRFGEAFPLGRAAFRNAPQSILSIAIEMSGLTVTLEHLREIITNGIPYAKPSLFEGIEVVIKNIKSTQQEIERIASGQTIFKRLKWMKSSRLLSDIEKHKFTLGLQAAVLNLAITTKSINGNTNVDEKDGNRFRIEAESLIQAGQASLQSDNTPCSLPAAPNPPVRTTKRYPSPVRQSQIPGHGRAEELYGQSDTSRTGGHSLAVPGQRRHSISGSETAELFSLVTLGHKFDQDSNRHVQFGRSGEDIHADELGSHTDPENEESSRGRRGCDSWSGKVAQFGRQFHIQGDAATFLYKLVFLNEIPARKPDVNGDDTAGEEEEEDACFLFETDDSKTTVRPRRRYRDLQEPRRVVNQLLLAWTSLSESEIEKGHADSQPSSEEDSSIYDTDNDDWESLSQRAAQPRKLGRTTHIAEESEDTTQQHRRSSHGKRVETCKCATCLSRMTSDCEKEQSQPTRRIPRRTRIEVVRPDRSFIPRASTPNESSVPYTYREHGQPYVPPEEYTTPQYQQTSWNQPVPIPSTKFPPPPPASLPVDQNPSPPVSPPARSPSPIPEGNPSKPKFQKPHVVILPQADMADSETGPVIPKLDITPCMKMTIVRQGEESVWDCDAFASQRGIPGKAIMGALVGDKSARNPHGLDLAHTLIRGQNMKLVYIRGNELGETWFINEQPVFLQFFHCGYRPQFYPASETDHTAMKQEYVAVGEEWASFEALNHLGLSTKSREEGRVLLDPSTTWSMVKELAITTLQLRSMRQRRQYTSTFYNSIATFRQTQSESEARPPIPVINQQIQTFITSDATFDATPNVEDTIKGWDIFDFQVKDEITETSEAGPKIQSRGEISKLRPEISITLPTTPQETACADADMSEVASTVSSRSHVDAIKSQAII
ncbi:hypothetical protein FSARC_12884 [Fusarium sarcochroum]|uniref:Nephrocystin 3-like N-terminal domain-containing protein n=1 Tax=Fusarium sarcochroum TaxID=1208366 RepID=A0A8H4T5B3_9HYPO|nr:hypothetical protein FSARC_12884 [Fusarium sarcochroum]